MLKILRNKKTAKKVWILLAIIIIPAFTLWGFGGSGRNKEDSQPAGKIFGKNVSVLEYKKSFSAAQTAAIMQFGDDLPKVEKYLDLESQAWERLILLEEARRRKLDIGDQEVINTIQNLPYFQKNSVFDNKTYVDVLHYVFRLQPRTFEEQMRQNLLLAKLYKQITEDVKIDDNQVRREWLKTNEELSIYYIASLFADFAKRIKPGNKDISSYYDKNKEAFRLPQDLNLEYVVTELDSASKNMPDLINKKYSLEKISQELNLPRKETGLFQQFTAPAGLKIPQGTINTALSLKPGEPAPMVKIDNAYYIFSLKETKPGRIPELPELKDRIKEIIIREKSRQTAKEKIDACAEALKKNMPFNRAAKAGGLKTGETKFFKSTDKIEKLGQAKLFWDTARKLKENQASDIFSDANGLYIIKLKALKPVDEDKFAKDKDALKENMLNKEKNKIFADFIEETKKKAGR